jgi:ribulose-phosphate 3-epimerase
LRPRLVDSLVADGGLPIDVHLMVERPEDWAVRFAKLGARSVAFHIEAAEEPVPLAKAVRAAGALAHLALLPQTQPSHIPGGRDAFDGVLLLTAPAGGGEFDAGALDRVRSLSPYRFSIVDGRIDTSHFELLKANGVALAVMGAELFAGSDHVERAKRLADLVAAQGTDLVPRVCEVPR